LATVGDLLVVVAGCARLDPIKTSRPARTAGPQADEAVRARVVTTGLFSFPMYPMGSLYWPVTTFSPYVSSPICLDTDALVEADSGCCGDIEALGAAANRDGHTMVGGGEDIFLSGAIG
jgi:hypothetical protein